METKSNTKASTMTRQLVREFWFPGVLALCWTSYSIWQGDVSGVHGFIKTFGPAFFLASWATAQYFRVSKQARVESDLKRLQIQTNDLLKRLDSTASRLSELATGGSSFCFVTFRNVSTANQKALMDIAVIGRAPMYDVRMRVTNIEMLRDYVEKDDTTGAVYKASFERNFGNIASRYLDIRDWPTLGPYPVHTFNIEWTARNGSYLQQYRMRLVDGRWSNRIRIRDSGLGITFDQCDDDYPVTLDADYFANAGEFVGG